MGTMETMKGTLFPSLASNLPLFKINPSALLVLKYSYWYSIKGVRRVSSTRHIAIGGR